MTSAHIMGIPVEESVLQLAPVGMAMVTAIVIMGRTALDRLRRRGHSGSPEQPRR